MINLGHVGSFGHDLWLGGTFAFAFEHIDQNRRLHHKIGQPSSTTTSSRLVCPLGRRVGRHIGELGLHARSVPDEHSLLTVKPQLECRALIERKWSVRAADAGREAPLAMLGDV